ncbi:uncharacterized protein EI97DRAFT_434199 [Westerdykella ornata]|uniref:Ecp2 effector protein domain-containing protein n=1 Tax=Westerdykella ornata TaxID=318751 RepID=A0A6A6JGL3_WESOR|nr:uncharacterized protein EI97DRAFT_434199 [Westerdykella ornata]KAF2275344.1 hypothetical protein EI97DRAFT_434199 [Westerdykella ornata]
MTLATLSILGLLISTSALALPTNNTTSSLVLHKREEGSCKDLSQPIEWQNNMGVHYFCQHWNPTPENANPSKEIKIHEPEVWTIYLNDYKGTTQIPWVYKVWISCTKGTASTCTAAPRSVTHEQCVRKMKELLSEGKLGNEYCVVDGTEDVLFQHGRIEEEILPFGWLNFESYRRDSQL